MEICYRKFINYVCRNNNYTSRRYWI